MDELRIIEKDLVPVYETDTGEKVVYGTELHAVLQVKSKFADWVKNRLVDCEATENVDYQSFSKILEKGGRPQTEYIIKLDTAKEMSMLERNDIGKRVRKYFIEVEKRHKQSALDCSALSPELQMFLKMGEAMAKQEIEQKRLAGQIEAHEKAIDGIKEAVIPVTDNWREEMQKKFNRIQRSYGIDFRSLWSEMYAELDRRAGADIGTRLRNRKERMRNEGYTKTAINNLNKMDIIESDKKLREIFSKIISEYEIKYCA